MNKITVKAVVMRALNNNNTVQGIFVSDKGLYAVKKC